MSCGIDATLGRGKRTCDQSAPSDPDVVSIGWDIAITPTGSVLIEGNDNWEITGPQDTMGGLKKKWREIHDM